MYVRDLYGEEYPIQCTSTWKGTLNGQIELTATIEWNEVNETFIHDLAEMWVIADHDDVEYKIIYCKKQGKGDKLTTSIRAIPLFIDVFNTQRIYEVYNQSFTAQAFFDLIFNGSGYNPIVVDSFYAQSWQGLGDGSTRLEPFKNGLNRYGAEFRLSGNNVYLETQIGNDTQIQYRYKLNASNISQEIDASEMYTYIRGYGDYEEGTEDLEHNAGLIREYTSPLANLIGIREAPPIKDGRITDAETMDEALKKAVDESLKISVQANIHDLTKQGYPVGQAKLGDRVFLIDERINLDEEVRIVDMSVTKDWKGNILDINITFGTQSLTKRYQSNLNSAAKRFNDILAGREVLPFNVLPAAKQAAMRMLEEAQTELIFGNAENGVQGIIAQGKDDPNKLVWLNSNGWMISTDGGQTVDVAATAEGIVADAITSGSIRTNLVSIIGESNYFYWDGNGLYAIDPNDVDRYVRLTSQGLYIAKGALTVEREDGFKTIIDGYANLNFSVFPAFPAFKSDDVEINGVWCRTSVTDPSNMQFFTYRHEGRYLKLNVAYYVSINPNNYSGNIYVQDGTTENFILTKTISNQGSGSSLATNGEILTIDLGVPDGSLNSFYLKLRSSTIDIFAYARVIRIWQEG